MENYQVIEIALLIIIIIQFIVIMITNKISKNAKENHKFYIEQFEQQLGMIRSGWYSNQCFCLQTQAKKDASKSNEVANDYWYQKNNIK